jgi:hypothetical protein
LKGTVDSIVEDLDKKDWREILGLPLNKNTAASPPPLTAEQSGTILIEIHKRAQQ